jgi:tyrosyl-tRNA synthetase
MTATGDLLADLAARGLVQDTTDREALAQRLSAGSTTLYHGIDPSASSMHVGNFIGVLMLRRFQDAGHRPIVLVGGATGMVGDPGGRSEERNLLDEETLAANVAGIRGQLERLVDLDRAELVNNFDWTRQVGVLDFLRDVGKYATVNQMVAKDSVRSRMESEHGISYTEFSYMLLQAHDYWWLHTNKGCELQIGGSDQWGNLTAGVDLIRRRERTSVHALTWPLLTKKDGEKYGKSAAGAIWLDPARTLPFEFHQYWLRTDDADIEKLLLQLTLLPVDEVHAITSQHREGPEHRRAQRRLADELTALVHGDDAVRQANLAAGALYGKDVPSAEMLEALRGIVAETTVTADLLDGEEGLVDLLVATALASSRGEARRLVQQGGIAINGQRLAGSQVASSAALDGRYLLLQRGKQLRHLVVVQG